MYRRLNSHQPELKGRREQLRMRNADAWFLSND